MPGSVTQGKEGLRRRGGPPQHHFTSSLIFFKEEGWKVKRVRMYACLFSDLLALVETKGSSEVISNSVTQSKKNVK